MVNHLLKLRAKPHLAADPSRFLCVDPNVELKALPSDQIGCCGEESGIDNLVAIG